MAIAPQLVRAQSTPRPTITSAPVITAEPSSQALFSVHVGPPDALPRNCFVRVRGLPPMAALSEGYAIGPGSWAVSIAALPELKINLPAGSSGRAEIAILLVAVDGTVLGETKSTLVIASTSSSGNQAKREARAPATASMLRAGAPLPGAEPAITGSVGPAPSATAMTPEDRDRARRLMKKGEEQLRDGNVSAARLFYERAADAGLADGAMALAATFDAAELARLNVRGIQPDPKEARRWYERARALGATAAEQRLRRLGAN